MAHNIYSAVITDVEKCCLYTNCQRQLLAILVFVGGKKACWPCLKNQFSNEMVNRMSKGYF